MKDLITKLLMMFLPLLTPVCLGYTYQQPDSPSLCDVTLRFEGGFLCAIQPSRLDSATRDTYFDQQHQTLADRYYGYGYHVVVFPAPGTPVKGVYVHFKGSHGRPYSQDTGKFPDKGFLEESAGTGYIMIELAYNNRFEVNTDECGPNKNLDNCAGLVRGDKIDGVGLTLADLVATKIDDTPIADSIEFRLKALTKYLAGHGFQFPIQFIDGDNVLWKKLSVGGHSQGAGMAEYLAKNYGVEHACILSGIHDVNDDVNNPPGNVTADWFLKPGTQTPVQQQSAVLCGDDPSVAGFKFGLSLLGFRSGTNYSVTSFPGGYFDEDGNSTDPHSAVVLDPRFKDLRDAACFSSASATSAAARSAAAHLVPVYRKYNQSIDDHFYTLNLSEGAGEAWRYEGLPFYVYTTPVSGCRMEWYRCWLSGQQGHLMTSDPTCEGRPWAYENSYGYVCAAPAPGTMALYRGHNPKTNGHFFTTSPSEFKNALDNGYQSEGIPAYVIPNPNFSPPQ